jgi:hypothetical protein
MGSSVGEDPERQVKLKAYMFQRRVLAVILMDFLHFLNN